jgi:outer membrane protein OmpA-like peptidoglycan-associated protein
MSEDVLGRTTSAMGGGAVRQPSLLNPPATHDPRSQSRRIFLFLLFLASGVVILSSWHAGSPEVKRAERMPVGAGLGLRAIELPDGMKLEAPRRGFIDSLATAVKSGDATDDEGPFIFDHLVFAAGSNTLAPSSRPQLEQLAAILRAFPQLFITIEGHTDNIGTDVYNKKFSAQRAQAVKAELAGMGVQSNRIATVGYGAARPIVGNSSDEGRARNRRIQVAITRR